MTLGLVLYQPEIAANLGAAIRIAACFSATLDVVEPCGFPWRIKDIDRVAMDYSRSVAPQRHASWDTFRDACDQRLILLTTRGTMAHWDFKVQPGDHFIIGQESSGVPEHVHEQVDARLRIPLAADARSLNMAVSGAVALAEARRQLSQQAANASDT